MKQIQISITKQEVFEDVALHSAYTGEKENADPNFFRKVATVKADNPLLLRFWSDMASRISERLQAFVSMFNCSDDLFSLTLMLSGAYDDTLTPGVKTDLKSALVAGVAARWYAFAYPEKTAELENREEKLLDSVISKLCHRKPPVKIKT